MTQKKEMSIYLYTAFTNMVFALPILVPYYNHIGLSFRDFLIGEAVFSAIVLLAEVPSGWISDVWKRRTTLILGGLVGMLGYTTLLFAHDLLTASLAQGIIGIAVALNSGTNTAILYDKLLEEGREAEYRKLDGQRHAMGLYAVAFAATVGAVTFTIHPKLPIYLDVVALLCAMIAIAFAHEPKRVTKSVEKHLFHDMAQTIKYALHGHKEIAGIILLSAVILCSTKLMMWSQQPYYIAAGVPVAWYGVLMTIGYIVGGAASQMGHKMEHWGTNRQVLSAITLILIVACLVLAIGVPVWAAVPLFLTGTLAFAIGQPRVNNAINGMVGSERRATVLSTASLMVHVMFIPTSLMVGYVSEKTSIYGASGFIALILIALGLAALRLWRNGDHHFVTAKER